MAKIVIDARESGTSTGRYVDKLIEHLYLIKPEHEFVVLTKNHRLDFIRKIAPKFMVVECPYKEFTFSEQLDLLKQLKKLQPDLVHFAMVQQPILYSGRVVTTMNDLTTTRFKNPSKNLVIFTIKQKIYKWVNKIAARKSAAILTFTEFVKDDVSRFARINSRKITVTYLAADLIPDKPKAIEELKDQKFIMYVGRPQPHKNLYRLMEGFNLVRQKHPELRLVLAGKHERGDMYKQIEKRVTSEKYSNIIFTGFVSEAELRWLYENTSAYVFPSLSEGFGLPGLEAMVHGAPVVSSNAACLPEVYKDGAEYFDPLSIEDMAGAILRVLEDETLKKQLIRNGKSVTAKYSWERTAAETLTVYNQVLDL